MKQAWKPALQWMAVVAAVGVLAACDGQKPSAPAPAPEVVQMESETVLLEPAAAQEAMPALDAAMLHGLVGRYPSDAQGAYLKDGALAQRLQLLLGESNYAVLLQNMGVASPMAQEHGRFFLTGNREHQGGEEMAAIVVDPASNALRVWLVTDGRSEVFQSPEQADIPWPADVQTMISNHQAEAK